MVTNRTTLDTLTCERASSRARAAWEDTGKLPGELVSLRAAMAEAVALIFNFTTNCHIWIKYFGQKHEQVNESIFLEPKELVPLIPHIYDWKFYLKEYKLIYIFSGRSKRHKSM